MARNVKITAGVLNIRLHPHPEGIYADYIRALYNLKKPTRIHGERWAMMSLINRHEAEGDVITGIISTFTKIDMDQPWFDSQNLKHASDEILSKIELPDGIFPNASSFNFLFDTKHHRLYVQTYSRGKGFSVKLANRMFQDLSDDLRITAKYGQAAINIVQSKAGLDRIFALPILKKIKFVLNKPNADVFDDDFDENIESYLQETKAKKLEIQLTAETGQSIKPNDSLQRVGASALEHGVVVGEGRDADGPAVRSSAEFPQQISGSFDPGTEQENLAFRGMIGR